VIKSSVFVIAVSTSQQNASETVDFLQLLIQELSHADASPGSNEDPAIANPVSQGTTAECARTELPEHPVPLSLPVTPPTSPEPVMSSVSEVETPERIKRSLSEAGSEKEVCAAACTARR
jgi:type IV secretory pathway VirB10-like protein